MADDEALRGNPTQTTPAGQPAASADVPSDALIVVPVRDTVLFPGTVFPITVTRELSIKAAQQALREQRPIGILMQRDAELAEPLGRRPVSRRHRCQHPALRHRTRRQSSPRLQGEQRFRVVDFMQERPFFVARVLRFESRKNRDDRDRSAHDSSARQAVEALELLPQTPQELIASRPVRDVAGDIWPIWRPRTGHHAAGKAGNPRDDRLSPSAWTGSRACSRSGSRCFGSRRRSVSQTKASLDERQREAILREQMAAIQRELGEGDGKGPEIAELSEAITKAQMPKEVEDNRAQGTAPLRAHAGVGCRIRHGAHLHRLAGRAAVGAAGRRADRHRRRAAHPRRRSLRPRKDQTPHHRVPRGAQAGAGRQGADPVFRRPARRRQNVARASRSRARWGGRSCA